MKTDNFTADAKTVFIREYAGHDDCNWKMEIKATNLGLYIDGNVIVPWDWILEALSETLQQDPHLSKSIYQD